MKGIWLYLKVKGNFQSIMGKRILNEKISQRVPSVNMRSSKLSVGKVSSWQEYIIRKPLNNKKFTYL